MSRFRQGGAAMAIDSRRRATVKNCPWRAIAAVLMLTPLMGGCGLLSNDSSSSTPETGDPVAADESFVGESQTIISDPSDRFQVTLPATWQEDNELHPTADIEASRRVADLYLIVLAESKTEIGTGFSLDDVSALYRRSFVDGLGNVEQVPVDTPAVGGYNAIQYRVDASLDGTDVVALHTTIETNESYYQIITWTKATFYSSYAEEMQVVINGFRELGSG
ncbi:MAG: hypothetical protein AAFX95_20075 [Cyanobacteria bacterium J06639_16]